MAAYTAFTAPRKGQPPLAAIHSVSATSGVLCPTGSWRDAQGRCRTDDGGTAVVVAPVGTRVTAAPGVRAAVERFLPGGATGLMIPMGTDRMTMRLACPSGWHPNKSDSWGPDGFTAEGTKCVRNRRRNNYNARAAKRSMRRLSGLADDMQKLQKSLRKISPRK